MTKDEYIRSLINQNITGDKMFELVKQWEIDNPQTEEVEEVKEEVVADQAGAAVTTTTNEASDMASESEDGFSESLDNRSLSTTFVPGTLDFYQARVANLGLSIEEEAKAINNMATQTSGAMGLINEDDFQKKIQVNTSSGYRLFTNEELQKYIEEQKNTPDSGFENIKDVDDYVNSSPHVSYVAGLNPNLSETYTGSIDESQPYNTMEEITLKAKPYYDTEELDNKLGYLTWENEDFYQRYAGARGKSWDYMPKGHQILSDYAKELYSPETQLSSLNDFNGQGREIAGSGVMENGGVVGYYDEAVFETKYGRNDLNSNDRLFAFDFVGGKNSKIRKRFSNIGEKVDDRITYINMPSQYQYRINKYANIAKENFGFTTNQISEYGINNLTDSEKELQKLTLEYENATDPDVKKNLGEKINNQFGTEKDLGKKLYDTNTGKFIDLEKADVPLAQLELYQKADEKSMKDIDVLLNERDNQYYSLNGLTGDILQWDNVYKEEGISWNEGESFMYTDVGNNQSILSNPKKISNSQLEKLKEFNETGKLPEGLTKLPGSHPLAVAFNNVLDEYTVTNKAIALNRNLATTARSWGFDEMLDDTMEITGADDGFLGLTEPVNLITQNEEANMFSDLLSRTGTDVKTELINYSTTQNFFQRNLGAIPHFGEFVFKMWGFGKLGGTQALKNIGGGLKEFGKGYRVFRNGKNFGETNRKYKLYTSTIDAIEDGLKFEGTSLFFDGDDYRPGEAGMFGATMKTGQIGFGAFSNRFTRGLSNAIMSPKSQALANNPFYRGITTRISDVSKYNTPANIVKETGGLLTGATGYQFASSVTDMEGYFGGLKEENLSYFESTIDEMFKIGVIGKLSKGMPGVDNFLAASKADIVRLTSRGKSSVESKEASKFFGIENDLIENPTIETEKAITDKSIELTKDILQKRKDGDISPEEAREQFNEVKKNERMALTQASINVARTAIDLEREAGNAVPTDAEIMVISAKLKNGEQLSAIESQKLSRIPKEILYDTIGIKEGTKASQNLENIYKNNDIIQAQLNGGGLHLGYHGIAGGTTSSYIINGGPVGKYNVSRKLTPELYKETYDFLNKKNNLNSDIFSLQKNLKENSDTLSTSDKIDIKKEISDKTKELERYEDKDGDIAIDLQRKLTESAEKLTEESVSETNMRGGSSKIINSVQEFQDAYNKAGLEAKDVKKDIAFIDPKTGERFINKEVASKVKDFTADTHEGTHRFLLDLFKDNKGKVTEQGIEVIDELLNSLSPRQRELVEFDVQQRYGDIIAKGDKGLWYEENLTSFSEMVDSGKIEFNETLGRALESMRDKILGKTFTSLDPSKVDGKQLYELFRDLSTNKEKFRDQTEDLANAAAEARGERTSGIEASVLSSAKKDVQDLIERQKSGEKIDETLLNDQMLTMAADALRFDVKKGTITQEEFESFAQQYFPGITRRYKPESGNQFSTFFYNNMRPKAQKFYESLEKQGVETSIDALKDRGREIEDLSEPIEAKIEESNEIQKDPFSLLDSSFKAKFDADQKAILDKAIDSGVDINSTKFKDKQALAPYQALADYFGIPVERITVSSDNFRKGDNVNKIQKWVFDNAKDLMRVALLPGNTKKSIVDSKVGNKKIKIGGGPMGIPDLIRKKFYIESKKENGNKQYTLRKDISIPEFLETFGIVDGKINKDLTPRLNQALKGIMKMYGTSLSNKSTRDITAEKIEEGVVTQAEGMATIASNFDTKAFGSSSSPKKNPTLNDQINLFLEQSGFSKMEKAGSLESSKKQRDLILNAFADKFGSTSENLIRWLSGGGLKPSTAKKRNFGFLGGKTENTLQEIQDKYGIDSKEYKEAEETLINEEFFTMPGLKTELASEITNRGLENAVSKEEARLIKLAIGPQNFGKLENNKKVYEDLQKGKDLIFDKFREIAKIEDGKYMPELMSMLYHSNANNHPFRNLATVEGLMLGLDTKGKENREEHVFQYGNFAVAMGKALTASDKSFQGFKEWSKENYYQLVLDKEQRLILDQPTLTTNMQGETIESYSPKAGMHPLLGRALAKAIETGDYSKVPDVRLRYANEYFSANLNKIGREVKQADGTYRFITDAEDFNITVDKPFQNNQSVINEQGRLAYQIMLSEKGYIPEDSPLFMTRKNAREAMNAFEAITPTKDGLVDQINKNEGGSNNFTNNGIRVITGQQNVYETRNADVAGTNGRALNKELKSLTAVDADNTTLVSKNQVIGTRPDGSKIMLRTEEFGEQASALEAEGVTFDFSDFMKIKDGKPAAYFKRLNEQYKQHGPENLFVVSARPPEFAEPMRRWLESNKINIPVENIIGLGNGAPQAKANWFLKKAAEGYNDFLFADDILANVKAVKDVIDQVDVKGEVQRSIASKPKTFDRVFNENLELRTSEMKGQTIGADWTISAARAASEGRLKNKNMFSNFFMGYSAEDFNGLLYETLPSGKRGDAMYQFYNDNLINPFNKAERRIESAKIAAASDFKALKSKLEKLPKSMNTETGIGNYSFGDAARVAVWTNQGMEIPGLSKRDQKKLNKFVGENGDLSVFVSEIGKMQKGKQYPKPKKDWISGTLSSDIMGEINKVNRKEYLQEWKENVSIIFSDNNKNKLRFAFGDKYVESLEDVLGRMESGNNRAPGGNRTVNNMLDWVNGSVGATMFLNTRSAALQTISAANYINWGDNNIYKAGKAFANQPQYWKDFKTLFNSDYLVNRREGLNINVAESEIAEASKKGGAKGAIAYLLNKGFVMTRGADSFAIASGGATMYRNRVKSLMDGGMPKEMAEAQAMDAWRRVSEENQQSSSAMRISQQQASGAGRLVLAYGNTPSQYSRIMKRAGQDLANNRGDWKTNVSKIVYYGAAQNLIFNALQNSLWTEAFDEDGDGDGKAARTINGMGDSLLKGLGIQGSAAIAIKNSLMTIAKENDKDSPEFRKAISDLFDFSPPLDTKIRKLNSAANTFSWQREEIANQGFNLNNPSYLATAQVISATTNIPADRAIQKLNNVRQIFNKESENWQKVALALGWSSWDVGLGYYGVEEKVDQTPEMILKEKVTTMKKETSIKEQKDLLLKLGLTKQQIKALKYENERVKKIIELQEKNKE